MKYIDADKLIAEIEKRQEELSDHNFHSMVEEYDNVIDIITSLQQEQPEVDLDDIIRVEFGTRAKVEDRKRYVKLNCDKFSILAHHFYELGLKARKEE